MRISDWSSDVCSSDLLVDQAVIALPTTADRAYLFMHYLKGRSEKYIATRMRLTVDQMGDRHVQTLMQLAPLLAAIERSEEHTSELQSLMRISYAVFCLKKKKHNKK